MVLSRRLNPTDQEYHSVLDYLVYNASQRGDRTGVGTYGGFGHQMRFDMHRNGFPILTTKKVHFKSVVVELLWMLHGDTNIKYLHDHGVTIWDEWADKDGNLGPVYGAQWRDWVNYKGQERINDPIDQIVAVIKSIRDNPFSRRHIVTAWNPAEIDDMALPPCHVMFQFYVRGDDTGRYLDCHLYQRSADWFLGVPFNMAQYGLLTYLIAREVGMEAGRFIHSFGDYHLYTNHRDQALEQLSRTSTRSEPRLIIDAPETASIFELVPDQIRLDGYEPHPSIKAPVAV